MASILLVLQIPTLPVQALLPAGIPEQREPATRPPHAPMLSLVVKLDFGSPDDRQPPDLAQIDALRMEAMACTVRRKRDRNLIHVDLLE
jgi:hypothetical protein